MNGRPPKSSGIKTALSAYISSTANPFFVPFLFSARIAILVTSLPVPQVVGTRTSSLSFTISSLPSYKSSTGETFFGANSFDISITVPPPIAMILLWLPFISRYIASAISSDGSPAPYFSWNRTSQPRFSPPKYGS